MKRGVVWVEGVGGRDAVAAARSASAYPDAKLYAVRRRGERMSYLGIGTKVTPANDGRAVWIQSVVNRSRCLLRKVRPTCPAGTDDGRLVLLARSRGRDIVAVWRPGQRRLAVATVHLPERGNSGSDSLAPLR